MEYNAKKSMLWVFAALAVLGCGEKKAKMGSAVVSFANGTSSALRLDDYPEGSSGTVVEHDSTYLAWTASTFGTKLVQIYLNTDVGSNGWDNVGQVAYIWINPVCGSETKEDGSVSMANSGTCDTTKITDYFELARPSSEVNAELNSQAIPIPVGTYRYARVQVCDNTISDPNIRFASVAAGALEPVERRTGNCVMAPAKLDPPITIGDGETIEISLSYDLSTALVDWYYDVETKTYKAPGPLPERCVVSSTTGATICARDFTFVASAVKK